MKIRLAVSLIIAVIVITIISGVMYAKKKPKPKTNPPVQQQDKGGSQKLPPVEVREYKGEKLSAISEFVENTIKGPQQIDRKTYRLEIAGLVNKPKKLAYEDILEKHKLYSKVITLNCVEGWSVKILWEGPLLSDVLNEAGVSPKANTVIFHCFDGYSSSLPLDYIVDKKIILASRINGVELPPERGFPFMVAAENRYGYKWAKWVTSIELSSDPNYKGYWEGRGYSNDGTLGKDFFSK